jgi:hypothetical protein
LVLHGGRVAAGFVALSLPPPWGRAGGGRAMAFDSCFVGQVNGGVQPPTLILPHKIRTYVGPLANIWLRISIPKHMSDRVFRVG